MSATDVAAASRAGRQALAEAVRHVGVRESPPGSNRTMFGRWFGVDGVPWCAVFASYCFSVGAGVTLCRGWRGAGVNARGVAYVPTLEAWLRGSGCLGTPKWWYRPAWAPQQTCSVEKTWDALQSITSRSSDQ